MGQMKIREFVEVHVQFTKRRQLLLLGLHLLGEFNTLRYLYKKNTQTAIILKVYYF